MQGHPVHGEAIVHLEVHDQHEREEHEEGADGEREALLELHVEHDARGLAARREGTARMFLGRRRPLTIARARAAPPPPPPCARPPADAADNTTR